MKIKSMRLLDRWVGSPLSAVLTVFRRITDRFRTPPSDAPRRILFVKLVEQGATVIAEPALQRAVRRVGRENVFMAVFSQNRFILDVLGVIPEENVIPIRSSGLIVCAIDTARAVVRMRRARIDTAIDFEFFSRFSGALTFLSGAKRRVGFHSFAGEAAYRGDLMTHRLARRRDPTLRRRRAICPFRCMRLGVGNAPVRQPGVHLLVALEPQPRREEALADDPDLVLDLTLLPA
jgi:hypothetical protein